MHRLLCFFGKRFVTDPAKQPLRSKEGVVIESVKTAASSKKAYAWHTIFNERRSLDVRRCLHILTKTPAFPIIQTRPVRNSPGQSRFAKCRAA
jgi:hypothetical protein